MIPAEIDDAAGEDAFYLPLSLEQADLIDRDVVVWVTATPEEIEALRALPVRETLDAAQGARGVHRLHHERGVLLLQPPVHPYLLDRTVPALEAAVDGDPATEVRLADA